MVPNKKVKKAKKVYLSFSGANPTIASYNATDSLARFENKIIFFYFEKRSSLLQRWRCSCKFKSRRFNGYLLHMPGPKSFDIQLQRQRCKNLERY
jgi:hypothetical protein